MHGAAEDAAPDHGSRNGVAAHIHTWWKRHSGEMLIVVLGIALTAYLDIRMSARSEQVEDLRAERQEIMENVRFVRERSLGVTVARPFRALNLNDADLGGLGLDCPLIETPDGRLVPEDVAVCTDFGEAHLQRASLSRASLDGANMDGARMQNADLEFTIMRGATAKRAYLMNVHGVNAIAESAHFNGSLLHDARFDDAYLKKANFQDAKLRGARFVGADLPGAIFYAADLRGANLSEAQLAGANLSNAQLDEVDLGGVCYDSETQWPQDFKPPPPSVGC